MSRSKHAAQGQVPAAPTGDRKTQIDGKGGIRTGWLLAVSLFGYALTALATRFGLMRAFAALFEAWGIDGTSVQRAPVWAQALYRWHGSLATIAFATLSLALSRRLRGLWRLGRPLIPRPSAGLWGASLSGILMAVVIAALCLLPDSMRLEWPLTAPRFTAALPVLCAVSLLSTLGEEAFLKRVLFDGLRENWNGIWAAAVVCAVFWLTSGGLAGGVVASVNVLLLGLACCLLYTRYGFWTSVGFRWGWGLANVFLLGFGGGNAAIYRLYGVSEALLTGADAGPMHGLWATVMLAGVIAGLTWKRK
jgi:hypothetical protein